MSIEVLETISLISFILAGISAVSAVLLWFVFKIPTVISDLSGRTARKSIERMRANNEKTGRKDFMPSKTNVKRGKVTELMDETSKESGRLSEMLSGKLVNKKSDVPNKEDLETGLLEENIQSSYESEETGLLKEDTLETEFIGTELLEEDETTLLVEEVPSKPGVNGFVLLEEIMFVHTDETID